MKIELEGHHVDITDGMKSIAIKKLGKLERKFAGIESLQVNIKIERNVQKIDVITRYMGDSISASASDKDFYKAVDMAATKLASALESRRGKIDTIARDKPPIIDSDSDDDSELEDY